MSDRIRRTLLICALCLGSLCLITWQAWNGRVAMNPDGISYMDIAGRLLQGDWDALANPYWSPLYPYLLSLFFGLLQPAPAQEFLVVHLLNWFIGWRPWVPSHS